ncbi:hypothetical protein [Streptococcus saliviloxodontae]|uniref:Bacteriocin n=1 Tax=Streptococcus saliviloxodontae TaxID=1349416 RepID=A0ABS2PJE3_9STRE|nr:hypothetical protein [Streptococcus saliviloxodontae]MBM7635553.1 hypothetical protein [Streptococcus saliviloxodontae]
MNTKTNNIFNVLSLDVLANITGGKSKDYCTGQVFGRIFTKKALGQIIVPTDLICR